jgi:hypothetical protein
VLEIGDLHVRYGTIHAVRGLSAVPRLVERRDPHPEALAAGKAVGREPRVPDTGPAELARYLVACDDDVVRGRVPPDLHGRGRGGLDVNVPRRRRRLLVALRTTARGPDHGEQGGDSERGGRESPVSAGGGEHSPPDFGRASAGTRPPIG